MRRHHTNPLKHAISKNLQKLIVKSPCGPLTCIANEQALVGLFQQSNANVHLDDISLSKTNEVLIETKRQLKSYFAGQITEFTIPIETSGTTFREQVWNALLDIPYGETRSYQDIAENIGNPKAARAVGMANHHNPIGIVIPCHRVVGKNQSLTGYAGGLSNKKKLLELERTKKPPIKWAVKKV